MVDDILSKLGGDLVAPDDCCLAIPGGAVLEEAERWLIDVGEVVFAIEPLFRNEPGRSPNLGKLNWKSPAVP